MCSWCWGLAPTVAAIAARDDVDTRIVVGGLRPGSNAEPLNGSLRETLARHWEKVAAASGQPFNPQGLDRKDWVYDTELPAIAVTTMRHVAGEHTLRFFTDLQQAFYADAVDITSRSAYPQLLAPYGLDSAEFIAEMETPQARARAWSDFAEARDLGVLGFPTILLNLDGKMQVLSRGYATLEHFDDQLGYWVDGRLPTAADVGTCSIQDGIC